VIAAWSSNPVVRRSGKQLSVANVTPPAGLHGCHYK
jgi:hypothetical protein